MTATDTRERTLLPSWMRATAPEYRFRFVLHGLIFGLGFWAPWHRSMSVQNHSGWFQLANVLSRPHYQYFANAWNGILVGMVLFALAGAALRVWGAAYLGASTVHEGILRGDQVVADGPYRHVRNPLYLGTILWTVPICMMMWPDAGVIAYLLIFVLQIRLIGREEPFLASAMGAGYTAYAARVPRLWPALLSRVKGEAHRPNWTQGLLSEVLQIGTVLSMAVLGWTTGYGWDTSLLRVLQGFVVSVGLSILVQAFLPRQAAS